jgi:dihydroorotate dehydrogenase (fumarate)
MRASAPASNRQIQQTGVDGLELNIYSVPCDPNETSIEIETKYLRIVAAVTAAVQIPIAVKVSPYFTSFAQRNAQIRTARWRRRFGAIQSVLPAGL